VAAAQAQASAQACAEAEARASVLAEACASALAQAQAMAQAAAQAAATASTSVEVVPDISTSVQSFIDPDCLAPTCEEYIPEYRPGPTGPTGACPEPQTLKWEFGQVTPGMQVSLTRPMPQELLQALSELGVVTANLSSSNLPPGLSFDLLLQFGQGRLTGQVPNQAGLYQVVYNLLDASRCVVGQLYVLITVGQPTGPTGPTGPQCPEALTLSWDFGEVKGGTLHLATVRQMPTELYSQIMAAGVQEAELLSSGLPTGVQFKLNLANGTGLLQGYMPPQPATYEVVYALYDSQGCEAIRLTVQISVGGGGAQAQPLQVAIRTAVDKVCGDEYSHAVTVYWQASGGTQPLVVGPIGIRYPDGHVESRIDHFPASGSMTFQVDLQEGGTVVAFVQVQDSQGRTRTAQQEVELEPCVTIGIIPPIRVYPINKVNLEIRAHHIIYVTPGYEDIEIPVRVTGEEEVRYTPFTVQRDYGSEVLIRVPARSNVAGPYGVAFSGFKVWIGDADEPVEYPGTYDRKTNTYLLRLTLNADTRVVAVYRDIVG
jgi:hypothetical protein